MITDKNTLKSWFRRGLKPLETQFAAWMDSYWHKSESIPTKSIEGLEDVLNNKAEGADIDNINEELKKHFEDDTRHKTEAEQGKLNNLANNPNLTYATKEELLAQGAIVIPVDFTITEEDQDAEIKAFVQPLIDDGSFWKKPVYANYIWKTDYTEGATGVDRSFVFPGKPILTTTSRGYEFNYPIDVSGMYDGVTYTEKFCIKIYLRGGKLSVSFSDYVQDPYDKTIFLVEDGDGIIISSDRDNNMPVSSSAWIDFFTALKNKKTPSVYLKTNNTDVFVPASYYLAPNDGDRYDGVIRIEYVKDQQLWIEDRKFVRGNGGGMGGYGSTISETTVQKIPIGKEFNSLILNLDLMTAEDGLNTQAFKDDVANQFDAFDGNLPIIIRFKAQRKADVFGSIDKYDYEYYQGAKSFAIDFLINDLELSGRLGGDSFHVTVMMINVEQAQQKIATITCNGFNYSRTLFLYDDNDGFIGITDNFPNNSTWKRMFSRWSDFYDELKNGRLPAVYIWSVGSQSFCPATYEFHPISADKPNDFTGTIEISYYKMIDGQQHLCREKRRFTSFTGEGTYEFVRNENGEYVMDIEKYPLSKGDTPVYTLKLDGDDVVTNPEIIGEYAVAYTSGKNPVLLLKKNSFSLCLLWVTFEESRIILGFSKDSLGSSKRNAAMDFFDIDEYYIVATKQGDSWTCLVEHSRLLLKNWDYMKASNIHVVAEYPTDLTTYPDGSIFIKTVS